MTTFVRTQEVEHFIGRNGSFGLRLTSSDVELRAVDGDTARVRIEFELRAASDVEADDAFARVQFGVRKGPGSLELAEPKRGSDGRASIAGILGIGAPRWEANVVAEVPRRAAINYTGVS